MFGLMKSGRGLKIGHVGSKTRSLGQILEKPCVQARGHIFRSIIIKPSQNVYLEKFGMSWKMRHGRPKSWSLGQILEKLGVSCRGHMFSPIMMELGQNVCLDEISVEFENGSCWVKKRSLG